MKIVIAGGTGQIGQLLTREYRQRGFKVCLLTRNPSAEGSVQWDGHNLGPWQQELDGANVVINLAGRTVNCRYTDENMKQMLASRIDSTRVIGEAIARCQSPPSLWLQMSTATIYEHTFDHDNDEDSGVIGGNELNVPEYWQFSIEIAKQWEKTLFEAKTPQTRKVALRSAMVMSPDKGGVFMELVGLTKKGLGGPIAGGNQYMSWIHEKDFIGALDVLMKNDFSGVINLAAPHPLPQKDFMKVMRQIIGMPVGLPATRLMAKVGAYFMRTDTELVLKSRRVVSKRLAEWNYKFAFPHWQEACQDLAVRSDQFLKKHYYKYAILTYTATIGGVAVFDTFRNPDFEKIVFLAYVLILFAPFLILSIELIGSLIGRQIYRNTEKHKIMVWSHILSIVSIFTFGLLTTFLSPFIIAIVQFALGAEYQAPSISLFLNFYVAAAGVVLGLPASLIFATWMGWDAHARIHKTKAFD